MSAERIKRKTIGKDGLMRAEFDIVADTRSGIGEEMVQLKKHYPPTG
ncbi:hypothetical protein [Pelagibacterium sp.]